MAMNKEEVTKYLLLLQTSVFNMNSDNDKKIVSMSRDLNSLLACPQIASNSEVTSNIMHLYCTAMDTASTLKDLLSALDAIPSEIAGMIKELEDGETDD